MCLMGIGADYNLSDAPLPLKSKSFAPASMAHLFVTFLYTCKEGSGLKVDFTKELEKDLARLSSV